MTSAPAIRFEYRPSRVPRVLGGVGVLLASVAMMLADLPWLVRLGLAAVVALVVGLQLRRRGKPVPRLVVWSPQGDWRLMAADGSEQPATLLAHRMLGSHVLLSLRAGARLSLWLTARTVPADTLRRLRIRLARQRGQVSVG